jgi:hypothetical protein
MFNRLRAWRLVGVCAAILLGTLATAPIVAAAKPDKLVLGTPGPTVSPAGEGCAFEVHFDPIEIKRTVFTFADGTQFIKYKGYGIMSNPESGSTFLHHVVMQAIDTFDPAANEYRSEYHGQFGIKFWPGDVGPYGVVGEPGLFLRFTGSAEVTYDADTFASTAFSYTGTFIDICSVLAG